MANTTLQENLKKYFYSGVGLAAHTAEVVQKSVNELVKKGKVSESDGKKLVGEAIKKFEARKPEIEAKYNEAVHKFVKFSSSEMSKLQKRIDKLEGQLKVKGTPPAHKPVAKPTAKKKARKRVRSVAKPAVSAPAAPSTAE